MNRNYNFVPNQNDDRHCFQACYAMCVEALTGEKLSIKESEIETGFEPDRSSWPFQGMLSLSKKGLTVKNIEKFDPYAFIENPRAAILAQCGDESIVEGIFQEHDMGLVVQTLKECTQAEGITFNNSAPNIEILKNEISKGAFLICNVNAKALIDKEGYAGHFVVVKSISENSIVLDNPGLPPIMDQKVTINQFLNSWCSPSPELANCLSIYNPLVK